MELAKHKPVVMVYSDLSAYGVCSIVTDDVAAVSRVTKSLFSNRDISVWLCFQFPMCRI